LFQSEEEKFVKDFEAKGISDQSIADTLNYGAQKFFIFLD